MNGLPASPLIAIDVGNTRIKFGLFDGDECPRALDGESTLPGCRQTVVSSISARIPWEEVAAWKAENSADAACHAIAGTNPRGMQRVLDEWPAELGTPPTIIRDPVQLPLEYQVAAPEKVGIDRLLNAVAANVIRPNDHLAVLIDSGTATTVDLVTCDGAFAGGAILPGFELSARSLHRYTALLPLVSMDDLSQSHRAPIGRNTPEALHSGLFWGQLGAIKELINALIRQEAHGSGAEVNSVDLAGPGHDDSPTVKSIVLLTGGGARLLKPFLPQSEFLPQLSLQGLALAAVHSSP